MKTVTIQVDIPDDATIGPTHIFTYLQPPNGLHLSYRADYSSLPESERAELDARIRTAMVAMLEQQR